MRIAHYYKSLAPRDAIARYVLRLAAAQEQAGHDVLLFARAGGRQPEGRHVEEVHGDADLMHRVRHRKVDILHTHGFVVRDLALGATRIVRTVHDHEDYCASGYRFQPWRHLPCEASLGHLACGLGYLLGGCGAHRKMGAWLDDFRRQGSRLPEVFGHVDMVVFASDYCKTAFARNGLVAPEAPVLLRPAPTRPAMQAIDPERPRLLYWGPFHPRQGLEALLEACARLRTPWELDLAGDGPWRGQLVKRVGELGLKQQVRLVGPVSARERVRLFERAWMHVSPILWPDVLAEQLLEASASGRATLTSRIGSLPEYLETAQAGWLTAPGDVEALHARLESALTDGRSTQQMGATARALAVTEWSMERHLGRLDELYLETLASS